MLLLLNDDNRDALNYSLTLDAKIVTNAYPYPVLWAANQSPRFRRFLEPLHGRDALAPEEVATCVHTLETVGALRHVNALMTRYAHKAASTLSKLPKTEARDQLIELALAQPDLVVDQGMATTRAGATFDPVSR